MKNGRMHRRAMFSLAGLREALRSERSFRTQLAFALAGPALLAVARPAAVWWALALLALVVASAFELMNAAIERLIDHVHPGLHPQIKCAKDMASGAAFVVNCASAVILACASLA